MNRAYSKAEALISLQLDYSEGNEVTVEGYASLWGWHRRTVDRFLNNMEVKIKYPEDTRKTKKQRGHLEPLKSAHKSVHKKAHITLIDFNELQGDVRIKKRIKGPTTKIIDNIDQRSMQSKKPVMIFKNWYCERYQNHFGYPLVIPKNGHGKIGKQIKNLLSLEGLSFEDTQYLALEFMLDDSEFLTGTDSRPGAGHGFGMLLHAATANKYHRCRDLSFRDQHKEYIVNG